MTVVLQVLLASIASGVAYGLYHKKNMWSWIVAYWIVLTVKIIIDCIPK